MGRVDFDPDPEAERKNAVSHGDAPTILAALIRGRVAAPEGRLRSSQNMPIRLQAQHWIQESPRRNALEMKHKSSTNIQTPWCHRRPLISVSRRQGFQTVRASAGGVCAQTRFRRAPFILFYLLPAYELVGEDATDTRRAYGAAEIGMKH